MGGAAHSNWLAFHAGLNFALAEMDGLTIARRRRAVNLPRKRAVSAQKTLQQSVEINDVWNC